MTPVIIITIINISITIIIIFTIIIIIIIDINIKNIFIIINFLVQGWYCMPCKQWFLRDATKGEKPLPATVCFSIEHARPRDAYVETSNGITSYCSSGNIKDLSIQRQDDGNENVAKQHAH